MIYFPILNPLSICNRSHFSSTEQKNQHVNLTWTTFENSHLGFRGNLLIQGGHTSPWMIRGCFLIIASVFFLCVKYTKKRNEILHERFD